MLNKFLILKNINFRRKNNSHTHVENFDSSENFQVDFLNQFEEEQNSDIDFGGKIFQEIKKYVGGVFFPVVCEWR